MMRKHCAIDDGVLIPVNGSRVFMLRENPEAGFWRRMWFVDPEDFGVLSVSLGQFGGVPREMNELGDPAGQCIEQERAY